LPRLVLQLLEIATPRKHKTPPWAGSYIGRSRKLADLAVASFRKIRP
jgi:hypothetical protein